MRTLRDELHGYLKTREDTPTALLLSSALQCVGIRESGGDNCGPIVELFQSTVSKPEKQSWCLSFVQSVIAFSEQAFNVKSPFPATELCSALFEQCPDRCRLALPVPGAVVIWEHEDGPLGHCGIVLSVCKTGYYTVEGNTSDGTGIDRDGDGVYLRYRPFGGMGKMKEVGFLAPFPT